jgi:regulator of replication initiation timing
MNKKEIKKTLKSLLDKFEELRMEFEELKDEVDYTIGEIEPYEYNNDLTPQQEARIEWLESVSYALETITYCDLIDEIEPLIEE